MNIASHYSVPILNGREAMTGENALCAKQGEKYLYADFVHPNMDGHLLLACSLASFFQRAFFYSTSLSLSAFIRQPSPIYEQVLQFMQPVCYSMLKSPSGRLRVHSSKGFEVVARKQKGRRHDDALIAKRCWEGNHIGDYLEFSVDPCTEILFQWYMLNDDKMGMARVSVDGVEITKLNGWFEGYNWTKGFSNLGFIASGLPRVAHNVRLEIIDEKTKLGSAGNNFQLIAVAVSSNANSSYPSIQFSKLY